MSPDGVEYNLAARQRNLEVSASVYCFPLLFAYTPGSTVTYCDFDFESKFLCVCVCIDQHFKCRLPWIDINH